MNTANDAALAHNRASLSDHDLENLIELWRLILVHDPDSGEKRHAEARMCELIAGRSQARVREMELERGLRAP